MRRGTAKRATAETTIEVSIALDGSGQSEVSTGIGFLDHMLTAFAMHGRFDLVLKAEGDLHVSQHHTVEDVGIVLGAAVADAVGDRAGLRRYGHAYVPMDGTLARTVLDLSGRALVVHELPWRPHLGSTAFDYALTTELLWGFARSAAATVHVDGLRADNNHHLCEAVFKSFGRALDEATTVDARLGGAPASTKGGFDGGAA